MAAGSRAWVGSAETTADTRSRLSEIAGWFGIESLSVEEASRYKVPVELKGDPVSALLPWTSDAARRFRIPRRGTIELGNVADLVIWRSASAGAPADMQDYRPTEVILNGRLLNLQRPGPHGRFFGR
jgi:predicted amidohydrolase YtcJ